MKYGELISFDPVIGVKVLTDADDSEKAQDDVRTYVISERMSERLRDIVLPALRFDLPGEKKCFFVVATYGTGKTHLMSVIGAVAEHAEFVADLTDSDVAAAATPIAGKFKVIRSEIGASKMNLRDLLCGELEKGLEAVGVSYKFKPADQVSNTKDSLVEMMEAFEAKYPDQGVLLMVDELLEYLRGRRDNELAFDLTVLREIGEISRRTRLRLVLGVQETIFDNPRFASAAEAVQRVKDRYEQIRIDPTDVKFVVKERLLKKDVEQRDAIRAHLQPFTPAFAGMAEDLEEFVSLFPVHPAYLTAFQAMTIVEKRKVLETLSDAMTALLDVEVPTDVPGLITYDSYRAQLDEDAANRQIESLREVLDKSQTLRRITGRLIANKDDLQPALRIIDALAINRLMTGDDIHAEVGPTASVLRDDLCLMLPGMPMDALFLETWIETVISEVIKAVSGQFITQNSTNGQTYLDVRKDIDYDQKIEERAVSLDDASLDRAYFAALEQVLDQRDAPYLSGYNIWGYNVRWPGHGIGRQGYLFFGAPDERGTAQPPRDYYLYFLQPYERREFVDQQRSDEVFFRLDKPDDAFTNALRHYAGASALAIETAVATHRAVYQNKAQQALSAMIAWLRANMAAAVSVTHRGDVKTVGQWIVGSSGPQPSPKDVIDDIASRALDGYFKARYPGYPTFAAEITLGAKGNIAVTVKDVISGIVSRHPTALASKILAGLELTDPKGEIVDTGVYATQLLTDLAVAGGRPLNRADLFTERDSKVLSWGPWFLEPAWLAVVAAAMCQIGRVEIGFVDGQIDAVTLDRLTKMSLDDLQALIHIAPPKPTVLTVLRDTVALVGIGATEIPSTGVNPQLVQRILVAAETIAKLIATARNDVVNGIEVWGSAVINEKPERLGRLDALQTVIDDLRGRDSIGKVNKIATTSTDIGNAKAGLAELDWVEAVAAAQGHVSEVVAYLREARGVFGDTDSIKDDAEDLHARILMAFSPMAKPDTDEISRLKAEAEQIRRRYADEATRAHTRARLDKAGDNRKNQVREGHVYRDLQSLANITILPGSTFADKQIELTQIGACPEFEEAELLTSVICPQCLYRPQSGTGPSAAAHLAAIEAELIAVRTEWETALVDNLGVPELRSRVDLLDDEAGKATVNDLLTKGALPAVVEETFVNAVNEILGGFDVLHISPREMWSALFPKNAPATLADLRERFESYLKTLQAGAFEERVRIVPSDETRR
jgi:Family of unknown function (DUF6079)